jgi:hypothetical protein
MSGVTAIAAGDACALAIAPLSSAISGTITPSGAVNLAQTVDFTFDDGVDDPFTWSTTLNPDGTYVIPAPAETVNIGVNGSKWLRKTATNVTVSGILSGLNATLLPGDLNGDNVIDIDDFSLFAQAYGSVPSSPNWNPSADLNCDGVVDLNDFSLFAQDYGLAGDPAP